MLRTQQTLCVQERAKRAFLITVLAHGLSLVYTAAFTDSLKKLGGKC